MIEYLLQGQRNSLTPTTKGTTLTTAVATPAAAASATKVTRARRKPLPGEVNITNDKGARALLDTVRTHKVTERAGAAAARERKVAEGALRSIMGEGTVLVIGGQPVAKVSSPRNTTKVDLEALALGWPEAYAAVVSQVPYTYLEV